jgi:type I restriction enzyme S subunit
MLVENKINPVLRFKDVDGCDYPDWEEKQLGEVSNINMGQSPDSSSYNTNKNGLYLIQGNADIKLRKTAPRIWTNQPTKKCKYGDIIMTVRAPVGAIAMSLHDACIGRGVCSIRSNCENNLSYLYQFLLSFEKKWMKFEQGSTFTAVNSKDVKNLKVNIPFIQEQQKIANFLSSIDKKIEQINNQITQTKQYKKALLQQMFV